MARLSDLTPEHMSDVQRRLGDEIASARAGVLRGPFAVLLRSPDLADRANRLGNLLRGETTVPRRLSELAIVIVARHWTAQYMWYAHRGHAVSAGIGADIVDAIAERRRPDFAAADERAVYDLCLALNETRKVDDATYRAAVEALGEVAVIELVAIVGFYTMLAMTITTFDVEVPDGAPPPLGD